MWESTMSFYFKQNEFASRSKTIPCATATIASQFFLKEIYGELLVNICSKPSGIRRQRQRILLYMFLFCYKCAHYGA